MNKFGQIILTVLALIGIFRVSMFIIDFSSSIREKFDDDYALERKEEEFNNLSKLSYGYGRLWGEETASSYELDNIDGFKYEENKEIDELREIAKLILETRSVDFACWGPRYEDCGDLPTAESLEKLFGINYGSRLMPINSFESGFIDAFVEYFHF